MIKYTDMVVIIEFNTKSVLYDLLLQHPTGATLKEQNNIVLCDGDAAMVQIMFQLKVVSTGNVLSSQFQLLIF